ncbi:transglutaminase domain-containing protein [Vibrio sinaloensis]|nr:transglutaminase domain-containing protein [Vibrio sinaloensis]
MRYLGMENGIGSHAPRQPEQILQQGYGDCKDKTLLLTALLRAIGVEAHPALVSTAFRDHLTEQPSGHSAFNHVIVTFEFAGKQFLG